MPNRYIRESAIESEAVNRLGWQAEVFWRRLLNRVDDYGRFTANLDLLRAGLFPLQLSKVSTADIGKLLLECESAGLVSTWTDEESGKRLLAMHKWENGRAKASKYPEPPEEIRKRLFTNVNRCLQTHSNVPDNDYDYDPDNDNDKAWEGLPEGLKSKRFKAAWREFLDFRKESRFKKLQRKSILKQWQEMAGWGEDAAIQSMSQSIRNGWQGVFAPKTSPGQKPQRAPKDSLADSRPDDYREPDAEEQLAELRAKREREELVLAGEVEP